MQDKKSNKIKPWTIAFWLLVWQILSMIIDQEILLVSPLSAFIQALQLSGERDFWQSILFSLGKISMGFLLAFASGILLAIAAVKQRVVEDLLAPLVQVVKSVPVASFIILCLIWLDTKSLATFISFLMVFPVIYTSVLMGIKSRDQELDEMLQVFKVAPLKRIRYIYMAQVMPYLLSACKIALGLCWKAGIAAEVIGVPKNSIGENLYLSKLYLDMRSLFAWTLVIICLSVLFEKVILKILTVFMQRLERY